MEEKVFVSFVIIVSVLILIGTIINVLRGMGDNNEEILFESKEFFVYKVVTISLPLVFVLIISFGVLSFMINNMDIKNISPSILFTGFTYMVVLINLWFISPRKLAVSRDKIFYINRFNKHIKLCDRDSIEKYTVEKNGKLKLTIRNKKDNIKTQLITSKLGKDDRMEVIKLIGERFMVKVN